MSILIKGMDMPKPKLADMATVYHAYVLVSQNGRAVIVVDNEDGLDSTEYPLVPVPPHGRLTDADEMFDEFVIEGQRSKRYKLGEKWELNGEEIRSVISRLPTVIPASEEGET